MKKNTSYLFPKGGKFSMKKLTTILLVAGLMLMLVATAAYAKDRREAGSPTINTQNPNTLDNTTDSPDTFLERYGEPGASPSIPTTLADNSNNVLVNAPGAQTVTYGASRWLYQDINDSVLKFEGSYLGFTDGQADASSIGLYESVGSALATGILNGPGYNLSGGVLPPASANDSVRRDRLLGDGRDKGPHGKYTTTTNKCKICHAVHRAEGAFALLRTDNADDACSYCHIGDHRHSVVSAFWRDTTRNIYAKNGHTIGSGTVIPDSSVKEWLEAKSLNAMSYNETASWRQTTIDVRRYSDSRKKIMRYIVHGGGRYIRVGPMYLRCMSCHQVHNASTQIWKPYKWVDRYAGQTKYDNGYKLLRNSPSGGLKYLSPKMRTSVNGNSYWDPEDDTGTIEVEAGKDIANDGLVIRYTDGSINTGAMNTLSIMGIDDSTTRKSSKTPDSMKKKDNFRLKVVDSTFTETSTQGVSQGIISDMASGVGSPNTTGYTRWRYFSDAKGYAGFNNKVRVYEVSMSFYCADCHNLNIGGKDAVNETSEVGDGSNGVWGTGRRNYTMLSDRTHPVPMNFRDRKYDDEVSYTGTKYYGGRNNGAGGTTETSNLIAVNITAISRSNGIVTATTGTKSNYLEATWKIYVSGVTSPGLAGDFNNGSAVVTIIDRVDANQFRYGNAGDDGAGTVDANSVILLQGGETRDDKDGSHCQSCHNSDMPYINISDEAKTTGSDKTINFPLDAAAMGSTVAAGQQVPLTITPADAQCGTCHITGNLYVSLKQTYRRFDAYNGGTVNNAADETQYYAGADSLSDWPHAGPDQGFKLLNAVTYQGDSLSDSETVDGVNLTAAGLRSPYSGGADALDMICKICHGPAKNRSIGTAK